MSVYNKAHELARAISQSREYSELKRHLKDKNDEKLNKYKDFRKTVEVQPMKFRGRIR